MYKLCFYVPETHLESVKTAVFATGAGKIGDYDSCCWQGEVEVVAEYRVELVCEGAVVTAAVDALIEAHPYETPAWDVVALVTELPQK